LLNKELRELYFSSNIIKGTRQKTVRWKGHLSHMRRKKENIQFLTGKSKGKR